MLSIEQFIAISASVGAFLIFHFAAIHKLNEKIHGLELHMKELEKKDDLQQQTIDQLQQLYPLFETFFKKYKSGGEGKK